MTDNHHPPPPAPSTTSTFSAYASRYLSRPNPIPSTSTSNPNPSPRGRRHRSHQHQHQHQRLPSDSIFHDDIPNPYSPNPSTSRSRSRSRSGSTSPPSPPPNDDSDPYPRLAGSSTTTLPYPSSSGLLLFNANLEDSGEVEQEEEEEEDGRGIVGMSRRVGMEGMESYLSRSGGNGGKGARAAEEDEEDEEEGEMDPFRSAYISSTSKGKSKFKADSNTGYRTNDKVKSKDKHKPQSTSSSVIKPTATIAAAAKKGWLAHQSIFPSRSRYSNIAPATSPLSEDSEDSDQEDQRERGGRDKDRRISRKHDGEKRRARDGESESDNEEEEDDDDGSSKASDPPSPNVLVGSSRRQMNATKPRQGRDRTGEERGDRKYHPTSRRGDDLSDSEYERGRNGSDDEEGSLVDPYNEQEENSEDGSFSDQDDYNNHRTLHLNNHDSLSSPLLPTTTTSLPGQFILPPRLTPVGLVPASGSGNGGVGAGLFAHWVGEHAVPFRKWRDVGWVGVWLGSFVGVVIALGFVWGGTDPTPIPPSAPGTITYRTPFSTLLHTIPLLSVLSTIACILPLFFLLLLKWAVRPVLITTAVIIPFSLIASSWWAFIASFEAGGVGGIGNTDGETIWWGTTGLRVGALIPLGLAVLSGRMIWRRWKRLNGAIRVVELSTKLLLEHPPLLILTPALLVVFTILSIPYLTLILRLLLIGYYRHPRENTYIWHVRPYAGLLTALVILLWLWSWVIIRGIGRVATAAIVGEWYFHREEKDGEEVQMEMKDLMVGAMQRATGTSLGSICLSSAIVAVMRFVGRGAAQARRVVHPRSKVLPTPLLFLSRLTPLFNILSSVLEHLNGYALIYIGITGEAFWPSAQRAVGLAGSRHGGRLLDYTFIKLLLTLTSTALAMACSTIGYLYAVHALSAPAHAPLTALLCGGVPFLVVRASAGVLSDASDAIFICTAIDREAGTDHCPEASAAFSPESKTATPSIV